MEATGWQAHSVRGFLAGVVVAPFGRLNSAGQRPHALDLRRDGGRIDKTLQHVRPVLATAPRLRQALSRRRLHSGRC
jgi:hypothetical protein